MAQFEIRSFYNPWVSTGGRRMDVVLSVTATDEAAGGAVVPKPKAVKKFGIVIDLSGSMTEDGKLEAVKAAASAAIDAVPDGAEFGIVGYATQARVVFPMTLADAGARYRAKQEVEALEARGRTFMSRGLKTMMEIMGTGPLAVRQVIFLSDGQNDDTDEGSLLQAVNGFKDKAQIHSRGIGLDWSPAQLRMISDATLGSIQAVVHPERLRDDLVGTMAMASQRSVSQVMLRLSMPRSAKLTAIRQAIPQTIDLTSRVTPSGQRAVDVPLGAFAAGTQDYAATFELAPGNVGDQMLVCRPVLILPGNRETEFKGPNVVVNWTHDMALSSQIDPTVAHYTGQTEKAEAIQQGLAAHRRGDLATATVKLGRAVQLAAQSGDTETTLKMSQVVDILDAATGRVTIKQNAGKAALLDLDASSTRTVRAGTAKVAG